MKTTDEIKNILFNQKETLNRRYNVKNIGIFGSYARGEQTPSSDVDILIELEKPIGLAFVELANYLELLLEQKVDVVSRGAIKPRMWEYVADDLMYV
ncbi:MAG: nucleotidyltransferase family protein [Ignavibacteriales bacterium]|nr:nucleotidyltransferase family protein [Ignavibacteriales bacterium]